MARHPVGPVAPVPARQRELLPLWLPPTLAPAAETVAAGDHDQTGADGHGDRPWPVMVATAAEWSGGPIEFDLVVPPSGNMWVSGRQFWLGPARAGLTVRFWADLQIIHLSIAGVRVKSVISHLTVADLARLITAHGAVPTGPPADPHPTGLAG